LDLPLGRLAGSPLAVTAPPAVLLNSVMDRIEEIETAITSLPPDDYRRLVDWFRAREQTRWDEQMDQDCIAGKLDFLFDEAESDSEHRLVRDWPPSK